MGSFASESHEMSGEDILHSKTLSQSPIPLRPITGVPPVQRYDPCSVVKLQGYLLFRFRPSDEPCKLGLTSLSALSSARLVAVGNHIIAAEFLTTLYGLSEI